MYYQILILMHQEPDQILNLCSFHGPELMMLNEQQHNKSKLYYHILCVTYYHLLSC